MCSNLNLLIVWYSLRYHLLHPDYLYYRIRELQKNFKLRVVLCHVDVVSVFSGNGNFLCLFKHSFWDSVLYKIWLPWGQMSVAFFFFKINDIKDIISHSSFSLQEDVVKPLLEVTKTALLHDCTLLCAWRLIILFFLN